MLTVEVVKRAIEDSSVAALLGAITGVVVFYTATVVIYNLYFHPLASFPGPKLWAAFRLCYVRSLLGGRLPLDATKLHEEYGEIVRVAPDQLSFSTAAAWKDIYGTRAGKPEMSKNDLFYSTTTSGRAGLIGAQRDRHGALRRLVSHGFSERALRDQEPLIQQYCDLLMKRLYQNCGDGNHPLDLVSWFNFFTFDVIGDLTFGEPFGGLESGGYHPWVAAIFDGVKTGTFMIGSGYYPWLRRLLNRFIPKSLKEKRADHIRMTKEKVQARQEKKTDRADFLAGFLDEDADASYQELVATSRTLIIAGSETTATLLSGITYLLLQHPGVLQKLTEEIRTSFTSEEEIDLVGVNKLKYLLAVLDEGLRFYPPVPGVMPRQTPRGGDEIAGYFVPEDTTVGVMQWATYRSSKNFALPNEFHPERFLDDPRFKDDNKAALQPFSIGPRNCVGRNLAYVEMRLVLARLLWNFDLVKLDPASKNWIGDQKIFILWEKHPLLVHLKPVREKARWLD